MVGKLVLVLLLAPTLAWAQGGLPLQRGNPAFYAHPDVVRFTIHAVSIQLQRVTAPTIIGTGADGARIYIQNNASGKQQLCVQFKSGAAQCVATEP